MSRTFRSRLACSLIIASFTFLGAGLSGYILPSNGQTQPELKKFNPEFVTEPGCPIEVISANSQLEMDPFGTPMAARHYIDYRNASSRQIAAVKFRIGYVADDGKIHQPYVDAPDGHPLDPGGQASQKWRGDRIDPHTVGIKIRVLLVKFADGSMWESQKLTQTNAAPQQESFQPLTTETPDTVASDRVPGTPVQFHDYGTQQYHGLPDRGATGSVPLTQTPNSTPVGAASAASGQAVGDSGFGAPSKEADLDSLLGAPSKAPAATPAAAVPAFAPASPSASSAAAMPPAAPSMAGSPGVSLPPSAPPVAVTKPKPIDTTPTDPIAAFDAIMGNSPKAKAPNAVPSSSLGTTGGGGAAATNGGTTNGAPPQASQAPESAPGAPQQMSKPDEFSSGK